MFNAILSVLLILLTVNGAAAAQTPAPTNAPAPTPEPWRPGGDAKASFGILLSPGVAPCVIHVNGLTVPLAAGTPLTARYDWDFGDAGSQFNKLTGFTAAHVFDTPGDYNITLTLTDEAGTKTTRTARVSIAENHRHVVFVDPAGSDANIGVGENAPFKTLAKAFNKFPGSTMIMLKAGATYESDSTLKVNQSDIIIGRYGDGEDPVVMLKKGEGKGSGKIALDGKCNGVLIEHITFDSPYPAGADGQAPKVGIDAIAARGRNVTVRNCTFLNVDNAINGNGSPTGLLVQNCRAPLVTGVRAYMVWGQGSDLVYLGNQAANSTREHIVRLSDVDRALIVGNDFTNLDRHDIDKYDTSKGTIEMHRGSYAYIADNKVAGGTIRVGPLGIHEDPSTATDWAVIEDNDVTDTYIVAYPGAHHVMIRNNVIRNDHFQAIQLQASDKDGRACGDIHILNNTGIDRGDSGAFLKVWGKVNGISLKNNLFVAPGLNVGTNGASAVNVADGDLSSFTEISHNVWPAFSATGRADACMINKRPVSRDEWAKQPQVKQDQFVDVKKDTDGAPVPDAVLETGEANPAVVFDRHGHRRPAGKVTVGAVEVDSSSASRQNRSVDASGNK